MELIGDRAVRSAQSTFKKMESKVRVAPSGSIVHGPEFASYISDRMAHVPLSESEGSFLGGKPVGAGSSVLVCPPCDQCHKPMIQVVQMWAPIEPFSCRALHVFVCSHCRASPGQWKAFRTRSNEPLDALEEEEEEVEVQEDEKPKEVKKKVASIGTLARVGDDELDALLAQNAQQTQKTSGNNSKKKTKKKKKKNKKKMDRQPVWTDCEIRPCWLDVVEKKAPKKRAGMSEKQADEAAAMAERLEREAAKDKESWAGEVYESGSRESKTFRVFQKALQRDPECVVRYQRGANPLWISEPVPETPMCGNCGKRTVFEMQLLPTLLYLGGAEMLWQEQKAAAVADVVVPEDDVVVDESATEIAEEDVTKSQAVVLPELIRAPVPEFGACAVFCCSDVNCGEHVEPVHVVCQQPE
jgi:hypothetical protein